MRNKVNLGLYPREEVEDTHKQTVDDKAGAEDDNENEDQLIALEGGDNLRIIGEEGEKDDRAIKGRDGNKIEEAQHYIDQDDN